MKKSLFLLIALSCSWQIFAQTLTYSVIQPACGQNFGNIQITNPLSNMGPVASNLYISEVVDANSGGLSYIEIYNGTGAAVNLDNYKLRIFSNGLTTPSCDLTLSGSIANYGVFVVAVGSSTNLGGVLPNLTFSSCTGFNNNDAVVLSTLNNQAVDLWGAVDGTVFTPLGQAGYTYRRRTESTAPSLTWNAADWEVLDPEDYTNVGQYSTAVAYQYSLDNGPYQSSPLFAQVALGSHTLTAQNVNTGTYDQSNVQIQPNMTAPFTNFNYNVPVCQGFGTAVPTYPGNFTAGGTFTAPASVSINPNSGIINLFQTPPGGYLITYTLAANMTTCTQAGSSSFYIPILAWSIPPQGEVNQTFTQPNPTLADFVVNPTTVTWFASYNDAVSNSNALALSTPLVDGVTYYAVNNGSFCPSVPSTFTAHLNLSTEPFSAYSLAVVPNPANSILTLFTHHNTIIDRIIISDVTGKIILNTTTVVNNQVNVEALASGLYWIEAFSGNEQFMTKLVKQ